MELYTFYRSSAAWRVRIALNLKGIKYRSMPVSLQTKDNEHHGSEYQALNPQRLVPMLVHGDVSISQSLAIIEYLDEQFPAPPLLPVDRVARARARQYAQIIASDIHPLNNLRVMQYLENTLGIPAEQRRAWYHHWILEGFDALELWMTAEGTGGPYCLGKAVSIADLCLVPQLYNARRYDIDVDDFPTLTEIEAHCAQLPAFAAAHPEAQADAPAA